MRKTATDWAHYGNCNVCIVDWSRLANYDYTIAARVHINMVSDAISDLMNVLIQHGMNVEDVSIAGHSLGAHVAALVGKKYSGKIATIYGMFMHGVSVRLK